MEKIMNIFNDLGVKIKLNTDDDFLKVKETLCRMGVESKKDKSLYQSCHILHKRGEYAILHFKEMFSLDGKNSTLTDKDIDRRNKIINLLIDWKLVELDDNVDLSYNNISLKIIPYSEKGEWNLKTKYNIGVKKRY